MIAPAPQQVGGIQSLVRLIPLFGPFSAEAFAMLPAFQPGIEALGPLFPLFEQGLDAAAPVLDLATPVVQQLGQAGFGVLAPLYGPYREDVLAGDTLVHCDLRDDNLLVRPDGSVLACDWNWPVVGCAWLDSLILLIGPRGDGLDVEAHLAGHPLLSGVDPDAIDAALALVLGYFTASAAQPVPPTSPYIRDAQAWQRDVVRDWLAERRDAAVAAGIARERIVLDPGIGFGKSLAENLALVNALPLFHALGAPLMFGASRKRMIGALSNEAPADERLGGSLTLALHGAAHGVQLLRVHDVAETVQALRVWRGLRDAALSARA